MTTAAAVITEFYPTWTGLSDSCGQKDMIWH